MLHAIKRQLKLVVFLSVVGTLTATYLLWPTPSNNADNVSQGSPPIVEENPGEGGAGPVSTSGKLGIWVDDVEAREKSADYPGPDVNFAVASDHLNDLGYGHPEAKETYQTYSIETLEALGDQGDFVALDVLADRYIEKGEIEKARETLEKEAMFGSTAAAIGLGTFATGMADGYVALDLEYHREKLIEGLAWYSLAALRGDPAGRRAIEGYLARSNIQLSPQEQEIIQETTEAIYSRLSKAREKRGLPEFSEPGEELIRFFKFMYD